MVKQLIEQKLSEVNVREFQRYTKMLSLATRKQARIKEYSSGYAIELGGFVGEEFVIDNTLTIGNTEKDVYTFIDGFLVGKDYRG